MSADRLPAFLDPFLTKKTFAVQQESDAIKFAAIGTLTNNNWIGWNGR
jgi:hypothetical protein